MKIGVLTEIINGHSGARAPLEIGCQLARLGNDITVYAYTFWQDEDMFNYLRKRKVNVHLLRKPKMGKYFVIPALIKQLKTDDPHVLYFSGTPPFFIAGFLTGIPIVRMYQGTQFDAYLEYLSPQQPISFFTKLTNAIANIFIYLIDFMSFRLSVAVVAISNYAGAEGKSLYHREVEKVIYHGISRFDNSLLKLPSSKVIRILSVSRITPYKGFHLIIKALKQIKTPVKFIFTIVGSQPKPQYVSYLKNISGPWLEIIEDPSDQKLAKLYSSTDIYATADRYLYFGLPVAEAAQFGVPSVALNFAAASEVISHGKTGYVAQNTAELSNYLDKLIKNDSLRKRFGKNAKIWIRRFSWERAGREWANVLHHHARN